MMERIRQWMALTICLSILLMTFAGYEECWGADGDTTSSGCGGPTPTVDVGSAYGIIGPYGSTQLSVPGFVIFYPRQLDNSKHPIITWGNGTEAPVNSYWALLRQLATWGFVVIASESMWTHNGKDMLDGLDYLLELNKNRGSIFYLKLDPSRVGVTGHSQGGGGAINAATDPRVKCALPIAPARGDIQNVKCPIFFITGSRDSIVPPELVRTLSYEPSTAPTIFGIAQGMGHFDFLGNFGKARGYITAWFMWQLKNDGVAAHGFVRECQICKNPDWTVEKKNF